MACKDKKRSSKNTSKVTRRQIVPRSPETKATNMLDKENMLEVLESLAENELKTPQELGSVDTTPAKISAIGKKKIITEQTSVGTPLKRRKDGFDFVFEARKNRDPLRVVAGKYWTNTDDGKNFIYLSPGNDTIKGVPFKFLNFDLRGTGRIKLADLQSSQGIVANRTPQFLDKVVHGMSGVGMPPSASISTTQQWVAIKAKPPRYSDYIKDPRNPPSREEVLSAFWAKWEDYMFKGSETNTGTFIKTDEMFSDHSFDLDLPFTERELEGYSGLTNPLVSKVNPFYNFYIKKYEEILGSQNVSEAILPNLYTMASEFADESNNRDFIDHITLNGELALKDAPWNVRVLTRERKINLKQLTGQYFDRIAREYEGIYVEGSEKAQKRIRLQDIENRFKNVLVPMENYDLLQKYDDKRFMFPMYVGIDFSTDKTTTLAEMLKESKLSTALMGRVTNNIHGDKADTLEVVESTEVITQEESVLGSTSVLKKDITIEKTSYRWWNLAKWINDFSSIDDETSPTQEKKKVILENNARDIGIYLGKQTDNEKYESDPNYKFFRQLLKIIFVGKLRRLIKDKFRTYEELLSGKPAYSETVFYRIEKLNADKQGNPIGEAIQNFYLPNSNEIDVMRFVDTQVKYGKHYVYRIYAYQAVIGTNYHYNDVMAQRDLATFMVTQYPSVILMEVPYETLNATIYDSPPVAPEIEPIPYRGVNNEILFFLRSNTGDYRMDSVSIEPNDDEHFDALRNARDLRKDEPIRFRTDDHTGIFQVFRSEEEPFSFEDFAGKMIAEVATDVSKVTPQTANAAGWVDSIEPNKRYWYTFRIRDIHGHISNPSAVYRIELVDERGMVFPLVETKEFGDKIKRNPSKPMRKYLMIAPALQQTIIDEKKSKIENATSVKGAKNVHLGRAEERVWGKKFKIRLISKNTSKKIDINVDFTQTDIRVPNKDELINE